MYYSKIIFPELLFNLPWKILSTYKRYAFNIAQNIGRWRHMCISLHLAWTLFIFLIFCLTTERCHTLKLKHRVCVDGLERRAGGAAPGVSRIRREFTLFFVLYEYEGVNISREFFQLFDVRFCLHKLALNLFYRVRKCNAFISDALFIRCALCVHAHAATWRMYQMKWQPLNPGATRRVGKSQRRWAEPADPPTISSVRILTWRKTILKGWHEHPSPLLIYSAFCVHASRE